MKRLQGIVLSAACLAASQVQAQEPTATAPQPATPNALTFPAQTPQPTVYPYTNYPNYNYNNYGYSAYPYSYYYPYAQQRPVYNYNPYMPQPQAYSAYNPYAQQYNPYAAQRMMPYPQRPPVQQKKEVKPWGDTRYIWPDFYTDFTGDAFDKMINAPYDLGRMPGGWQFPSISMPDPVTVSDAIANQVPPFAEEAGNMVPVDDMGNIIPFK